MSEQEKLPENDSDFAEWYATTYQNDTYHCKRWKAIAEKLRALEQKPEPESCLNCRNYQLREYTEDQKMDMRDDYLRAMNSGMKATEPDYSPRMVCLMKGWLRDWDAAIVRCEEWAAPLTEAEKLEADRQRLNALVSRVDALEHGLMGVESSISNYGTRNQRRYTRFR